MTRERAVPLALVILLLVVMFGLTSCASLGLPTPKSTEDRLVYSYVSLSQTAASVESLFRQKRISKQKATKVLEALKISLTLLDKARDLHYLGKAKEAAEVLGRSTSTLEAAKEQLKGGNNAPGT